MRRVTRLIGIVLSLTFISPALTQLAEAQGPPKVKIVHKGKIIEVGPIAAARHILLHGDTHVGHDGCPPTCPF